MRWLRRRMDRLGIDVNSTENGIFLPSSTKVKQAAESTLPAHSNIHTEAYKQNMFDRLRTVTDQISFEKGPNKIASKTSKGNLSF
ncbi:AHH domain-containing protein [Pseudomonas sp. RC4D1]|nr:AHH domain-containing protein [Pseudomonas sp. RC4D1]